MQRIAFSEKAIQFIIEQYTQNKMNTKQLGEYFHCSRSTIERRLKENNITLKAKFPYEDLTGQTFGKLIVIEENKERYTKDLLITHKPHRYWWCKCNCGNPNLIQVESSHLKNGHTISCGCVKSKGEDRIVQLLIENNISFKKEYTFSDLKGINNGIPRYDFAIFNDKNELQYLIEYHGNQHYTYNGGWNTLEEFNNRQENDKIKKEYAEKIIFL